MVSALVPGASGPGLSPGRGHCVVFLGKTLNSHCASLHPGVYMGTSPLRSVDDAELVIWRFCFAGDGKEMYKDL